jgi:hypothetical protein
MIALTLRAGAVISIIALGTGVATLWLLTFSHLPF